MASENGLSSTTTSARILPLAANHLLWSIGRELKQPTPISKSKEELKLRQILSNKWGVAQSPSLPPALRSKRFGSSISSDPQFKFQAV